MKNLVLILIASGALTGCVGSKLAGRDVDTTQTHPDLHSVPDRPKTKDFIKIEEEREEFEHSYETKLDRNDAIRHKYKAPEKKEHAVEDKPGK